MFYHRLDLLLYIYVLCFLTSCFLETLYFEPMLYCSILVLSIAHVMFVLI